MTAIVGTAGGNKSISAIAVGTAGGNKAVSQGWVGTAGGNKLFFSSMSVSVIQYGSTIYTPFDPDPSPKSPGDEYTIADADAQAIVTGGTAPYSYSWTGAYPYGEPSGPSFAHASWTPQFDGPSIYVSCIVTDANGVQASGGVSIS